MKKCKDCENHKTTKCTKASGKKGDCYFNFPGNKGFCDRWYPKSTGQE